MSCGSRRRIGCFGCNTRTILGDGSCVQCFTQRCSGVMSLCRFYGSKRRASAVRRAQQNVWTIHIVCTSTLLWEISWVKISHAVIFVSGCIYSSLFLSVVSKYNHSWLIIKHLGRFFYFFTLQNCFKCSHKVPVTLPPLSLNSEKNWHRNPL